MINFTYLENILAMDFKEMRAITKEMESLTGEKTIRSRASDEAITYFVNQLNLFYAQLETECWTGDEKNQYIKIMREILEKISQSEQEHYKEKYALEGIEPDFVEMMAQAHGIKDLKALTTRMQYWAAEEHFADTIRNVSSHKKAVAYLLKYELSKVQHSRSHSFFSEEKKEEEEEGEEKISNMVGRRI